MTTGTLGALDGNAAANQTAVSYTLALANAIASGATFWFRYQDFNATGSDDGLGIDNFSITPIAAVTGTPGALTIADVSIAEGNSGTTDMVFTVTRAVQHGCDLGDLYDCQRHHQCERFRRGVRGDRDGHVRRWRDHGADSRPDPGRHDDRAGRNLHRHVERPHRGCDARRADRRDRNHPQR